MEKLKTKDLEANPEETEVGKSLTRSYRSTGGRIRGAVPGRGRTVEPRHEAATATGSKGNISEALRQTTELQIISE